MGKKREILEENKFDFIIIGAGTAGCIVTNILACNTKCKIAVLEAGPNYDRDKAIRRATDAAQLKKDHATKYFWSLGLESLKSEKCDQIIIKVVEEESCTNSQTSTNHSECSKEKQEVFHEQYDEQKHNHYFEVCDKSSDDDTETKEENDDQTRFEEEEEEMEDTCSKRRFPYTGGRLFGGKSSINGLQFVKGTKRIFRKIKKITNDPDWGERNVFNLYKEIEKYKGCSSNPLLRGLKGCLSVRQTETSPMADKFVKAVKKVTRCKEISDYNDPETPIGAFSKWQLNLKPNSQRESSSTAYLEPIFCAKKDKFDNLTLLAKCTVLKIVFKDKVAVGVKCLHNGKAKEISASKAIICCAGIQSPYLLLRSGIGPCHDLKKAGIKTVFDHPNVGRHFFNHPSIKIVGTADPCDIGLHDHHDLYTGGAFLENCNPCEDYSCSDSSSFQACKNPKRDFQIYGLNPESACLELTGILVSAKSEGSIKIIDSDPLHDLNFTFNYFSDKKDIEKMKNLTRIMANIIDNMGPDYTTVRPPPEVLCDDNELERFIMDNFEQALHIQGACKMGKFEEGGVVDSCGQVYGVENLLIADSSIYPVSCDGDTTAPAYLAGAIVANKLLKKLKIK